jgi:multisubunit Na+/H+ antiporter MnhE subunit
VTSRPLVLTRLAFRFLWSCVAGGIATARIILRREPPPSGLVRMRFAPMSATGAATLGALVTLTPGSSAVDVDPERREMLLHLLDLREAEATVAAIRRDLEGDVAALFPEEHA